MALNYRRALAQPMLTAEEEVALIARWREQRDERARDRLITTHMRICYSEAARYDSNEAHIKDLAQEGVYGLMRAIERFEPEHGTRFATYARWWVRTFVAQAVGKVAAVVDMPSRTYLGARSASNEDDDVTWEAKQAAKGEVPLDAPVGDDGETSVLDLIRCHRPDPEAETVENNRLALMKKVVGEGLAKAMSEREADVLRRRMLSETPSTLEQIANDYGVSRERVRQIETIALDKLRKYLVNTGFPKSILR